MKSIIRSLAAAAICVASCQSLSATDLWTVGSNPIRVLHATSFTNGAPDWQSATGNLAAVAPGETLLSVMRGGTDGLGRTVVVVGGAHGLYRSMDNGLNWYDVSGSGSGLEATTKYFAAILTAPTSAGTTDILVGAVGSTNGGIYLSGDNGLHWMQINQGFDPSNLSITTLVKTSCSGCPVQYYSGSYGGGVYTRTISVNYPPVISGWCFGSTSCTCSTAAASGPTYGGQAFKLCGQNFQQLAAVNFGWLGLAPVEGATTLGGYCTITSSTIVCQPSASSVCGGSSASQPGTPAFGAGPAYVVVRNTDTRTGLMPIPYTFNNILY